MIMLATMMVAEHRVGLLVDLDAQHTLNVCLVDVSNQIYRIGD